MPEANPGVDGRPNVGDETLAEGCMVELGRASLDGERPAPGGSGEEDRGGGPDPLNFFWVNVNEKIAWDRDD